MDIDLVKVFLPKFLSAETEKELYEGISQFPEKYDQIYTSYIPEDQVLFQGDCLESLPFYKISKHGVPIWKNAPCILLSNTCDMDIRNSRKYSSQIVYAPIFSLEKFKKFVLEKRYSEDSVNGLISEIKKQRCTQLLYLPANGNLQESVVFLDRLYNMPANAISRDNLQETRIETLNIFGSYLLLLKISIHFTRMKDTISKWSVGTA